MLFINKIIADNLVGARNKSEEYPCRNVDDAIEAVKRLNGRNRTQVVLKGQDRALIIGGGNDGRYSITLTIGDDKAFYTLINPESTKDRDVTIVTGGQAGAFPENQCVGLASVVKAVQDFVDSGRPSAALTWVRE